MQAYMRENASFEFDRLQKLDKSEREADATYKFFGVEYNDSHSREEFQEKVRDRLEKESFRMDLTEAKALSRTYVTDKQIEEWGKCISSGALLLVASGPNSTAFPLKVSWVPPKGTGEDRIWITVDGGKIKLRRGKEVSDITEKYIGRTTKAYIVKPARDSKQVVITAFIHGDGEAISVNLEHQKVPPPPPPVEPKPVEHRIVNESVDVILCSGRNCSEEPGVRDRVSKGNAQLLRWEATQDETRSLGFQLLLPETTVRKIFCKSPNKLTADEFAHAVRDAKFLRFVSNPEQKPFFDIDDAWFVYGPSGRFSFVNNYQHEPNHHLEMELISSLESVCA
jgi:hypothetical protein